MLSKTQIKVIKSLSQKKYRHQLGLFTVEGVKNIREFLNSDYELNHLYTTASIFNTTLAQTTIINAQHLKQISQLKTPNTALAVFKIPNPKKLQNKGLIVALDAIRDPGNLGTIIRLCDWFGITQLVCSTNTVDCYNTKVVQASMGSLTRVQINYLELKTFLNGFKAPIFGTFMDGEPIYNADLTKNGLIVLGNEANGISEPVAKLVTQRISIPQFGNLKFTESLNVANATAIVLSEFLRRPPTK